MSEEITSFQQIEASAHLEELIDATQNLHDFARDSIRNRLTDSVALIRGGGRLDVVTKRLKEDIDTLSDLGALPNGQAKENFYNALRYPSSSLFDSVFSAFSEVMTTNGVYPVLGNNPLRKPSIHDGLLVYPVGGQSAYVLSRRPLVTVQPFSLTPDFLPPSEDEYIPPYPVAPAPCLAPVTLSTFPAPQPSAPVLSPLPFLPPPSSTVYPPTGLNKIRLLS